MWLKTALSSEEVEQFERPENVETLKEISCIRWDRQGHHPVREEVRRSAARVVDEIAAFQIASRKGGGEAAAPPAAPPFLFLGKDPSSEKEDWILKIYTVFKIDHIRRVKEPVGLVLERRNRDRGNNFEGLLKVAKKKYPPSRDSHVVLELIE